jgi:hypothetical protein
MTLSNPSAVQCCTDAADDTAQAAVAAAAALADATKVDRASDALGRPRT